MKKTSYFRFILSLFAILTFAAFAAAEDTQSRQDAGSPGEFDGIWIGSGKVMENFRCGGGDDIPIAFIVENGVAKSLIQHKLAQFEVKVNKKGKIKFYYRDVASQDTHEGSQSIDMVFTGKLRGLDGEGRFYFGRGNDCKGKWTVEKKQ